MAPTSRIQLVVHRNRRYLRKQKQFHHKTWKFDNNSDVMKRHLKYVVQCQSKKQTSDRSKPKKNF